MSAAGDDQPEAETIDLPDTTDLAAVNEAEIAIIRLAARRRMTVREALDFSRMLEHRRRAIGDVTLEEEMRRLEAEGKKQRGEGS
jgi:hypothetical protein